VITNLPNLAAAIAFSKALLMERGTVVDTGTWQGVPTEGHPDLQTLEFLDLAWVAPIPDTINHLREEVGPNLPWVDEHFEERVGRKPTNPGLAYKNWPWWHPSKEGVTQEGEKFTHTYQERIWPKKAGVDIVASDPDYGANRGIRYLYGDLDDVVDLLRDIPTTRQAYLPIFFPEDTGAVHRGRTPCTIGYQFLVRNDQLHCFYMIRSCDLVRHFRDDIYLAARLAMWVLNELGEKDEQWGAIDIGNLSFHCFSFHVHKGDLHHVNS
jgi:hypothetical protein